MADAGSPLAGTEAHLLRSDAVGDTFKIFVGWCGEAEDDSPLPIVYVTDANGYFGMAVDIVRGLQLSRHVGPMLIVGIGYPRGGIADTIPIHVRDLSWPPDPGFSSRFLDGVESGGGPRFLRFLVDELRPWLASRYPVGAADAADATYFGHSLGGLFGATTLVTEPSAFARYILGSPSLWWSRYAVFDLEAQRAASHDDLVADVYLAIGADETDEGRAREASPLPDRERALASAWPLDMVDDLDRFVAQLSGRGYRGLHIRHDVFPGEFHITVFPVIFSRGLRHLLDAP